MKKPIIILAVATVVILGAIWGLLYQLWFLDTSLGQLKADEQVLFQGEVYIANGTTTALYQGLEGLNQNDNAIYQKLTPTSTK